MRFLIISLTILLFACHDLNAQSPGGVAGGNTMWLRSDIGLTSAANIVSQWQELSGANVTGNFTVQSLTGTASTQTGPTIIEAGINFNPYLRFDGFTNSLSSLNIFAGTSLVSNSNVSVFQVFNLHGGIVWLKWETDQVGSTGRLGFENAGGTIRFDFPKAVPATAGQNVGITNIIGQHTLSTCYADNTLSVNRLNGAIDNTLPIPGPGDFSFANDKIVIGNENLINLPAEVDVAELVIYSGTLSAADRNKVESYLAVKYGFTLNQAAANANDYTASNGSITWNRAANSGYAFNITGIGRDDASSLSQKQSKSVNTTGLLTLYNGQYSAGNFPLTNAANTNTFNTDGIYLLTGDNGAATTIDQCVFSGRGQRMQRVWKVSKTGADIPVTIAAEQASLPAGAKNLIVSADPAFPAAGTSIYPLTVANGKMYTDVVLHHDEYFTYATDTIVINMLATQPVCSNPNSGTVVTTISGGNPPYLYSWSPSGQVTANLINVTGGTYTLTVTQGTCQASQSITLTSPASPASPVVNAVAVCPGSNATLNVVNPNAAFTYNWYASATGGTALASGISFTTGAISTATTFYVETISGVCASIRTAVNVNITTIPAPVANGVSICPMSPVTLSVQNPDVSFTYNWFNTATGGIPIGTGVTLSTSPVSSSVTFYVEAVSGTCVSIRTAVTVTITSVTVPIANNTTICTGASATLTVVTPEIGLAYVWYNAATGGTALANGYNFTTPVLTANTTYYLEAATITCSSIRTAVTVTVNAAVAPVIQGATICPGSTVVLQVQNPIPGSVYSWYDAQTAGTLLQTGSSFSSGAVVTNSSFYVEAFDGNCPSVRTPVLVNLLPAGIDTPRVTATNITGNSISFSWPAVAGAAGYQVSVDGINYLPVTTSLDYTVSSLEFGESVTISVIAIAMPTACGNSLPGHASAVTVGGGFYVPAAFTPNGDMLNDILIPQVLGGAMLEYFIVFNRWGQKVFTTKVNGAGWDGKWQGKIQPLGTFVWICRYSVLSGRVLDKKGTFTLLY